MSVSLLNLVRPTFNLLGTPSASNTIGARLVARGDETKTHGPDRPTAIPRFEGSIEPMLAVYDARVETLRIVVASIKRMFAAIGLVLREQRERASTRRVERVALPE